MNNQTAEQNPMRNVLSIRDFRLLFAGISTSLLGDQFALIATPWLVLQLTGDPVALGTVLALEGIPRALFMLFGGAITDRLSPRVILIASDVVRFVLAALMTFVVVAGVVEMWMLYAFSLGFGLVAGFAVPAGNSIVPMVVEEKDLQAGNSIVMGAGQLVGFVGPVLAGILDRELCRIAAGHRPGLRHRRRYFRRVGNLAGDDAQGRTACLGRQ